MLSVIVEITTDTQLAVHCMDCIDCIVIVLMIGDNQLEFMALY